MPSIAGLSGLVGRLFHSDPRPYHKLSSSSPPSYESNFLRRRFSVLAAAAAASVMIVVLLVLSLAPCAVWGACYRGYRSAFSFDAGLARRPDWMASIPDHVPLSELSIPGTHDTMTYAIGSEHLECQNWNLSVQLDAGLRYFDIRARLQDDQLQIYHADGYTGFSFVDVLLAMFEFLDANPSEAIVMRLKQEGPPIGRKNTISFEDAFNLYRQKDPLTSTGAVDHLFAYNRTAPLPTLGQVRSRIFLLQQFPDKHGPYGLEWEGSQMSLEDYWVVPDIYHLADKWTAIRGALELAATAARDNSRLFLAHVSASIGVLPIEAAAGPMNRTVVGMNDMTGQWVEDFGENPNTARTGIVIFDFPGKRLVDAVLRWNEPLKHKARRRAAAASTSWWWAWTADLRLKDW